MKLARKQVNALIKCLGEPMRESISHPIVSAWKDDLYLVGTDSYVLFALALPKGEGFEDMVGKHVPRRELIKWYKLAEGSDVFTHQQMYQMLVDSPTEFPKWQTILDDVKPVSRDRCIFDAKYLAKLTVLAGDNLDFKFYAKPGAPAHAYQMMADHGDDIFVLMPMRGFDSFRKL